MKKVLINILIVMLILTITIPIDMFKAGTVYAAGIQVKNTNPSTNAAVNSYITVEFYDSIQSYTYFNNITLKDSMGNTISCWKQISGNTIIIKPYLDLNANTKYTVNIPQSAVRQSLSPYLGNEAYSFDFTTSQNVSPLYIASVSTSYYGLTAIDSSININFSKKIQKGYNFEDIKLRDSEGNQVAYKATLTNQTMEIKPTKNLEYNTRYYIYIPEGGVKDIGNNYYNNSYTYTFATELDTVIPNVKTTSPKDGEKNTDRKKSITIQFDKKIEKGIYFDYIKLRDADGSTLTRLCEINGNTLTIKPESLNSDAYYTVEIPAGAVYNAGGSPYALGNATYAFSFTTATDTTAPEITASNPIEGEMYVQINKPITINFSKSIVLNDTGNTRAIELKDGKGSIPLRTYVSGNTMQITLDDGLNLSYNTKYTLTISSNGIKDFSGNKLKKNFTLSFTTEPQAPSPKIIDSTPKYNEMNASPRNLIKLKYNDAITEGTKFSSIVLRDEKNNIVKSTPVIIGDTLYIVPGRELQNDTKYSFVIPAEAVNDSSGNSQKETYTYAFKTEKESIPPEVKLEYPVDGATNVAVDADILLTFTEKIQKGSTFNNIVLKNIYGEIIPITTSINDDKLIIDLSNNLNMSYNISYNLFIPTGAVKDMVGNELKDDFTLSFTAGNGNFSPVVKMVKPASLVPIDSDITVVFSSNIQLSDNAENIVVKDGKGKIIETYKSTLDDKLVLTPAYPLAVNTVYTVTIPEVSVQDDFGNVMKKPYTFTFKTENEKIPPTVKSIYPANNSKGINTRARMIIKFSEAVQISDSSKLIFKDSKGKSVPVTLNVSNDTLYVQPKSEMALGTTYTLIINKGAVKDMAGNTIGVNYYSSRLTTITKQEVERQNEIARQKAEAARKAEAERQRIKNDKTPPKASSVSYSKDYKVITVTFNENIAKGSNFSKIQALDFTGRRYLALSSSISGRTLKITIKSPMKKNYQYGFIVPSTAIKDIAGNTLTQDVKVAFVKKR